MQFAGSERYYNQVEQLDWRQKEDILSIANFLDHICSESQYNHPV